MYFKINIDVGINFQFFFKREIMAPNEKERDIKNNGIKIKRRKSKSLK